LENENLPNEEKPLVTPEMLVQLCSNLKNKDQVSDILNIKLPKYNIDNEIRIKHFLSQIAHESCFNPIQENLSYSVLGMQRTFGCRYGAWDKEKGDCYERLSSRLKLWSEPNKYSRNRINLGNYVYANRMGNGNELSGEGYKFRGRGFIQLTGKENYSEVSNIINLNNLENIDLVENPDLLLQQEHAIESALIYWDTRNINSVALDNSRSSIEAVTKKINGGTNGIDDRINKYNKL